MEVKKVFRLKAKLYSGEELFATYSVDFNHYPSNEEIMIYNKDVKEQKKYGYIEFVVERVYTVC